MSNQYLTFDVTKANQVQQLIVGRQGDNALKSVSMLFWDGEKNRPYDLTGKQVYFEALKPDNSHIVDYAGVTITDPKYGLATYAFNEQVFAVQGMMQQAFFKISETDSNGNVTTDSSLEVSINVLSNSVEFGIKSEDYLSEYDRLVADVEKKFDDYANTVSGNIADVAKAHDDIQALMKQISDNNIVTVNEFNITKGVAQTALNEERLTGIEVHDARSDSSGKSYDNLKARLDDTEVNLTNNMNAKIAQISSVPETFANLSALQSTYPNGKTGLFVTADTGHKYIWANGSWYDAGVYQSVGIADRSINPSALSDTYDLRGDGIVHADKYIQGYDGNGQIILGALELTGFNALEISRNKTGIVHLPKNTAMTSGQAVLITDAQNNRITSTNYDYHILSLINQAVDYFVFVNETDVLINLDRTSEAFGDEYKVWVSFPNTLTSVPLTNTKNNSFRNYLK